MKTLFCNYLIIFRRRGTNRKKKHSNSNLDNFLQHVSCQTMFLACSTNSNSYILCNSLIVYSQMTASFSWQLIKAIRHFLSKMVGQQLLPIKESGYHSSSAVAEYSEGIFFKEVAFSYVKILMGRG